MKNKLKLLLSGLLLASFLTVIVSCDNSSGSSSTDDPEPETPSKSAKEIELEALKTYTAPKLVEKEAGWTDPFKGNTYKGTDGNDKGKYVFDDEGKTITYYSYYRNTAQFELNSKYNYVYDSVNGILYVSLTHMTIGDDTLKSYSDLYDYWAKFTYEDFKKSKGYTGESEEEFNELLIKQIKANKSSFETIHTWRAYLEGENLKLRKGCYLEGLNLKTFANTISNDDLELKYEHNVNYVCLRPSSYMSTMQFKGANDYRFKLENITDNSFTGKESDKNGNLVSGGITILINYTTDSNGKLAKGDDYTLTTTITAGNPATKNFLADYYEGSDPEPSFILKTNDYYTTLELQNTQS